MSDATEAGRAMLGVTHCGFCGAKAVSGLDSRGFCPDIKACFERAENPEVYRKLDALHAALTASVDAAFDEAAMLTALATDLMALTRQDLEERAARLRALAETWRRVLEAAR